MLKILILLPVLMASACGMQGDLYLPDEGSDVASEDSVGKSSADFLALDAVQKT